MEVEGKGEKVILKRILKKQDRGLYVACVWLSIRNIEIKITNFAFHKMQHISSKISGNITKNSDMWHVSCLSYIC